MITQEEIKKQIEYYVNNEIYCRAGDVVETYIDAGKIDIDDTLPPEGKEVFEWWFVSVHLAEWLAKTGAVIVYTDYLPPIWGRCETGQSVKMDSDIERAAIAILEAVEQLTSKYKK